MPTTNYLEEGPDSAIFPYEQLKEEEEAKKKQLQDSQKKIQRTNSVGEAFRLLIDSAGGSKGATIRPRDVNPGTMKASEKMYQIERDSDADMDRLRLMDLQNKQNDLRYNQGLAAEARGNEREDAKIAGQREWEEKKISGEREWREGQAEEEFGREKEMAGEREKSAMRIDTHQTNEDIRKALAVDKAEQSKNPYLKRYATMYGNKSPFLVIPDTEQGTDIPLGDGDAIQVLKWMRSDPAISQYDKMQIDPKDLSNNLKFKNLVVQNWDRYKDLVRKLASGQAISPEEEKGIITRGERMIRQTEYDTRLKGVEAIRNDKKRERAMQGLQAEYPDLRQQELEASQAASQPAGQISLKPDQSATIDQVINATASPEQKRSAVFGYLVKQGYDQTAAKEFAEFVYQNLNN